MVKSYSRKIYFLDLTFFIDKIHFPLKSFTALGKLFLEKAILGEHIKKMP